MINMITAWRKSLHFEIFCLSLQHRGEAVGKSVSIACGRLGVWIPPATELSRKNRYSDSSTFKRSATGVTVTGPRKWQLQTDILCPSRCDTQMNPHSSMVCRAKVKHFASLHGNDDVSKQTNEQANKQNLSKWSHLQKTLRWGYQEYKVSWSFLDYFQIKRSMTELCIVIKKKFET